MGEVQHAEAKKLLRLIESAIADNGAPLDYRWAAKALGRDPKNNSRMVAQVCDLLDAAAALAGVPLLALVKVLDLEHHINPKAWASTGLEARHREAIVNRSLFHKFTHADFAAIADSLDALTGKGNRNAWKYVRAKFPDDVLYRRLTSPSRADNSDAIDDLGTDAPDRVTRSGISYARDPGIRDAVMKRAKGKCEFCGAIGFKRMDGATYLECHHIIALAEDGADRMTNVIALCPNDHREAHFGERWSEIEKQMIQKVMLLEGKAAKA
jgi:HNH endonuclease